jgi:hypothetical protein
MVHVYFGIHVKCTKSTCFCSENTVKTHENTWKHMKTHENTWKQKQNCAFHVLYMVHVYFGIHVISTKSTCFCSENTVKTHENTWKHMKTLAKLCISCIIYGTCVFWYTCEMYQIYMFLQWKHSENTWKHMKTHENTSKTVHFMYNIWFMCNLV